MDCASNVAPTHRLMDHSILQIALLCYVSQYCTSTSTVVGMRTYTADHFLMFASPGDRSHVACLVPLQVVVYRMGESKQT